MKHPDASWKWMDQQKRQYTEDVAKSDYDWKPLVDMPQGDREVVVCLHGHDQYYRGTQWRGPYHLRPKIADGRWTHWAN